MLLLLVLTALLGCSSGFPRTSRAVGGCPVDECRPPRCQCPSVEHPRYLETKDIPQFVMLTFDDGVTITNFPTYEEIQRNRTNKHNGCKVSMTLFLTHEYTNYALVHELHRQGNEIASHSISHVSNTEFWKRANESVWRNEMVGMKEIASRFAVIPNINGTRVPFLQTGGNITFRAIQGNFTWDSSLPTRQYAKPALWPHTLDYGNLADCVIQPCPDQSFKGFWSVPMVSWFSNLTLEDGGHMIMPCSMADACRPVPETAEEAFAYFKDNFLRHYDYNRAPFPFFLHEAWLQDEHRKKGYFQFIDWLLQKDDVFLVTVSEVVDYMKFPVKLSDYKQKNCVKPNHELPSQCGGEMSCQFDNTPLGGTRYMTVCGKVGCPKNYPWVGNPKGL